MPSTAVSEPPLLITLHDGGAGVRTLMQVEIREPAPSSQLPTGNSQPTLDFVASTATLDRYREVIEPAGCLADGHQAEGAAGVMVPQRMLTDRQLSRLLSFRKKFGCDLQQGICRCLSNVIVRIVQHFHKLGDRGVGICAKPPEANSAERGVWGLERGLDCLVIAPEVPGIAPMSLTEETEF